MRCDTTATNTIVRSFVRYWLEFFLSLQRRKSQTRIWDSVFSIKRLLLLQICSRTPPLYSIVLGHLSSSSSLLIFSKISPMSYFLQYSSRPVYSIIPLLCWMKLSMVELCVCMPGPECQKINSRRGGLSFRMRAWCLSESMNCMTAQEKLYALSCWSILNVRLIAVMVIVFPVMMVMLKIDFINERTKKCCKYILCSSLDRYVSCSFL